MRTSTTVARFNFNISSSTFDLRPFTFHLLPFTFLLFTFFTSHAQTDTLRKDTTKNILLQDVTIKSTRADKNYPTTYTNVSGEDLAKTNLAQDLPILLDQTPSIVTTTDAGTGVGYTYMSIRGSDATRINVTINGVPYNDPEEQAVYYVDIPDIASSVENIQIQRGVGTSTNGADAFGATINIQTSNIPDKAFGNVSVSGGSFDTYKVVGSFGTGLIDDKFAFEGRISKISSDGYVQRGWSDLFSYYLSGGYFGKKDVLKFVMFSGIEHTYQAWDGISYATLDTNRTYNPLGENRTGSPYPNQTDNYWQNTYQLIYNRQFNSLFSANVTLYLTRGYGYYEEYQNLPYFSAFNMPNVTVGNTVVDSGNLIDRKWLNNYLYGTVFSMAYDNSKNLNVTFGGGWNQFDNENYGEVIWSQYYGNANYPYQYYYSPSHKNDLSFYGKASYRPTKKLNVFADLQYRNVAYVVGGTDGTNGAPIDVSVNQTLQFFNPKCGISYDFDTKNSLYTSFAIGNHEPMRDDYINAIAGQMPKPEEMKDLEAGYNYRTSKFAFTGNYYLMYYKDQLVLTGAQNAVGAPIRTNVPKSYRTGIELQAKWKPIKQLAIDANVTWSMNKILNFQEVLYEYDSVGNYVNTVTNNYKNPDISFSPTWIAGAVITALPIKNLQIAFSTKAVSKEYLDNTQSPLRQLNPYAYSNLRISYTIQYKKVMKEIVLSLMVNNIFNVKFESNGGTYSQLLADGNTSPIRQDFNYYYPQAGINVLGGVTLKF